MPSPTSALPGPISGTQLGQALSQPLSQPLSQSEIATRNTFLFNRGLYPPAYWVPDHSQDCCDCSIYADFFRNSLHAFYRTAFYRSAIYDRKVTFATGKHHCRRCGAIRCDSCTQYVHMTNFFLERAGYYKSLLPDSRRINISTSDYSALQRIKHEQEHKGVLFCHVCIGDFEKIVDTQGNRWFDLLRRNLNAGRPVLFLDCPPVR